MLDFLERRELEKIAEKLRNQMDIEPGTIIEPKHCEELFDKVERFDNINIEFNDCVTSRLVFKGNKKITILIQNSLNQEQKLEEFLNLFLLIYVLDKGDLFLFDYYRRQITSITGFEPGYYYYSVCLRYLKYAFILPCETFMKMFAQYNKGTDSIDFPDDLSKYLQNCFLIRGRTMGMF